MSIDLKIENLVIFKNVLINRKVKSTINFLIDRRFFSQLDFSNWIIGIYIMLLSNINQKAVIDSK